MTSRFDDQIVLITGGTGELGQHVTRRFLELGARVVVPFLSEQEQQTFFMRFPETAKAVLYSRLDARDSDRVRKCVDEVSEKLGPPSALINLVGGYSYGPGIVESEWMDFQHMLELNLAPTFHFCRSVVPHMLKAGRGKIVTMGARAGLEGSANGAAYAIAKAAVIRFTESLAAEVKHLGINVNCVLPSIIDTAPNRREMSDADFTHWVAPEDLAEVIAFLASDASRALHGASIPVYGRV